MAHMQPDDPYKTPGSSLEEEQREPDLSFYPPRRIPMARGFQWYVEGFRIFTQSPGAWILMMLIFLAIMILISFIPLPNQNFQLGNLVDTFLLAGLMLGIRNQENGVKLGVESLFSAFKHPQNLQLLIIGILSFVIYGVISYFMLNDAVQQMETNMERISQGGGAPEKQLQEMLHYQGIFYMSLFKMTLVSIPAMMLFWFSAPLVVLHRAKALAAIVLSFQACLYNIPALLLFLVLGIVFAVFATLPLGLGWLILMPVFIASTYLGWKDIFTRS